MTWAGKSYNRCKLISEIRNEIDANSAYIPMNRISDIDHYLEHGEYSMAFEYLLLEIMEREDAKLAMDPKRAIDMATFFELYEPGECMIDDKFWSKLQAYLSSIAHNTKS